MNADGGPIEDVPSSSIDATCCSVPFMIRHVLLLKVKADATPEDIEASRAGLAALVGTIPGLLDFHWGENIAPVERRDGLTHGFSMDFADPASLEGYGPHPQHKIAAARLRSVFERIIVFDFVL
jgi:Stress responsive A/B Barrel Domain